MVSDVETPNPEISDDRRWNIIRKKAEERRIGMAFRIFRDAGIEPILIKGWAAAQVYPDDKIRLSVDTDLAVSATDLDRAVEINAANAERGIAVDLHRELRHLDTLDWDDLFKNSRLIETDDGQFRVLRPEDHLRVLCVHWLNDGGASRERLWDIYYAIANREPDFDWDRFLNVVPQHRRRWMICTVGLARHFLGLELSDTPIASEADDAPAWLIKACEREMASPVKFLPLHIVMPDRKLLFQQLKKRLRPNPIWATIEMEGSFDTRTRIFYQVGNVLQRIMPSFRRVANTLFSR